MAVTESKARSEQRTGRISVLVRIVDGKITEEGVDTGRQEYIGEVEGAISWTTKKAVHIDDHSPGGFWLPISQIFSKGAIAGSVPVDAPPSVIYVPKWLARKIDRLENYV